MFQDVKKTQKNLNQVKDQLPAIEGDSNINKHKTKRNIMKP